jgi:cell division protein FtsB
MFNWLKTSLTKCVQRYQEKRLERLLQENRRLKAQLWELNDGQPIRLSPDERRELTAKRQKLDPEVLQALDAIDLKEPE